MSEERTHIIWDIESGYPYKVTKAQYDSYMKMWEYSRPILNPSKKMGSLLVFGTGAVCHSPNSDFQKMWYDPS